MPESDSERLAAFRAGEPAAVAAVAAWIRLALAPFRGRLGDDVEDLAQEALAELVVAARRLGAAPLGTFRGFVFRLTVRSAIDRLRSRRRWRFEELAAAGEPPAREPSALDALLREESRQRLIDLFEGLPALCRELFRQLLEGLGYREMAERHGVAEGTLRVRVLRCRRRAIARALGGNATAPGAPDPAGGRGEA